MPTSAKPSRASELFVEGTEPRQDAPLHEAILAEGDAATADAIGYATAVRLIGPERAAALFRKQKPPSKSGQDGLYNKAGWNEDDHPRAPAGSPDGGQFVGGGGAGSGQGKPSGQGSQDAGKPDAEGAPDRPGRDGGGPDAYARRGPSATEVGRDVAAVYEPLPSTKAALEAEQIAARTFEQLTPQGAARFHDAITAAKAADKYGAAVHAYRADQYKTMRLFATPDGKSGFALNGDDIVSVFRHPGTPKGFADCAIPLAIQAGGKRLDGFDTVLPRLYSESGFRAVARLAWDEKEKPAGWDYETFKDWNGGRPDVVFMVHDPEHATAYQPGDGQRVESYDVGTAAQKLVLERLRTPAP